MGSIESYSEGKARPKVLVVDDDQFVRDLLVESVQMAGCDTEACEDGWEALELATKRHYDLIITDMRLPGLDGLSLIRRISVAAKETDVIVITGYGTIENAVECMKAGALEYIIKPFNVDQVLVAIRKALDHRELRRRAMEGEFYRELSYIDSLTGIYNRRYFDEALAKEIEKSLRRRNTLCLLMLDIDNFKAYNDANGHQRGDEALKQLGELLSSTCRAYDIVCRYGGEEFTVIVPGETKRGARSAAERIIDAVNRGELGSGTGQGTLTVSIGISACPEDATNSEHLIRCADIALYKAKRAGKNCIEMYEAE